MTLRKSTIYDLFRLSIPRDKDADRGGSDTFYYLQQNTATSAGRAQGCHGRDVTPDRVRAIYSTNNRWHLVGGIISVVSESDQSLLDSLSPEQRAFLKVRL